MQAQIDLMEPPRQPAVARFGTYEVSMQAGELRKAGVKIRVQQQPMKLLQILLERPGEVVTRDELRNQVWPNESFGDFDQAVNIAITKLRSALGDSADNPRFIETLPKRGYRFIAQVTLLDSDGRPLDAAPAPGQPTHSGDNVEAPPSVSPRAWPARLAVGLAVFLILGVFAVWQFRSHHRASGGIRSLAVLPLDNFSGDASQDYFADGMTDQLITDLAQISALRVISRTSVMAYKGVHKSLPEIARELNVDAVVEGSVQRSGDHVRITAQLIEASSDKHLWADSYEYNLRDTLTLQKKVAGDIAEHIRIELTPQEQAELRHANMVNPEAYEAYLKGRYFWNKRTADGLKEALTYFDEAIKDDPQYAQAYAGLADTYDLLGDWEYGVLTSNEAYPKAKAAAMKAIELDDSLSEAHTSLAFSMDVFDWDWNSADKEYRRAIELNPGYATAHHWYADHLIEMGRNSDAIAEMRKAEHLDPLSLIIRADMAGILLIAHHDDEAIEESRKTIQMDPNFPITHLELGQAFVQKRSYNDAIAEFQKAIELSGGSFSCTSGLAYAFAASDNRDAALKILNSLKARSARNASEIALVYVGLGEKQQAMEWLGKAYDERFNPSILMRPAFDPLRSDPHFQNLVHRIGLPET